MDEQMQQLIVALVQAAMLGDQLAKAQIQQVTLAAQQGDPQARQLAQFILQVAQQILGQQTRMAKFGAKLDYIKFLNNKCPNGYEMLYFKKGGAVCKKCMRKASMEDGGKTTEDVIGAFKCGRKMKKKACGGSIKEAKCGSKVESDKCGKKVKVNKGGTTKGGVTLKSETSSKNKYGDIVTTRRWSDGTRSRRYTPEEGESIYEGRNGERGVEQQDSLWRADWRTNKAPQRKKQ